MPTPRKKEEQQQTAKTVTIAGDLKLICPEMTYKLWYKNDEGNMTYDDYIPEDIIDLYCDKVNEALEKAYFFRIKHPKVTGVVPGVETHYGKMHGTLNVSLNGRLTQNEYDALRESLTDLTSEWSIYFEHHQIKTDGGDLYVRFYDSTNPILADTAFEKQAYIDNCFTVPDVVKFYENEGSCHLKMMYYNPDSDCGGQLVENHLYPGVLENAFKESESEQEFWDYLDEHATQYLIDLDSPEFISEIRNFVEQPCSFSGQDWFSMDSIRNWMMQQQSDDDLEPEITM